MPHYLPQAAIFLPKHPYLFQDTKYEIKKVGEQNYYANYPADKFTDRFCGIIALLLLPLFIVPWYIQIKLKSKPKWYTSPEVFLHNFRIFIQETFFEPAPDDWDKCVSIIYENIYEVYDHIKLSNKPAIIYGYEDLTEEELSVLEKYKLRGWDFKYLKLDAFYLIFEYIKSSNLKVSSSAIVVLTKSHFDICSSYGFHRKNWFNTNLLYWLPDWNEDKLSSTAYTLLDGKSVFNPYIQGKPIPGFERNTIIILSSVDRPFLNNYLFENYIELRGKATKKGFELLHFPTFKKLKIEEFSLEYLKYYYPEWNFLESNEIHVILDEINTKSEKVLYNMLLSLGDLPLIEGSATLRVLDYYRDEATFTTLKIPDEDNKQVLDQFFEYYFLQLAHTPFSHFYSLDKDNLEGDEEKKEMELKLREIFDSKKLSVSLGLLLKILGEIKIEDKDLNKRVNFLLQNTSLITGNKVVSPILIDRNYRIFFTAYGNIEFKIPTLSKVIYIFFLKHPEGIVLKDIYLHKAELINIYMRISTRSDEADMEKSIDDMIDPLSGSLNQKLSRIQHNLNLIMYQYLTQDYAIKGSKGLPYKITIDRNLIQFSDENHS
jgi:hypothetical protein